MFAWREIDAIRVKGRAEIVRVYEPLGDNANEDHAAIYAQALAKFRSRDFSGTSALLARTSAVDPPSSALLARARELAANPPPPDWDGVNTLDEK